MSQAHSAVSGQKETPMKQTTRPHTRAELQSLLAGKHITAEFRSDIKAALAAGTAAALHKLGPAGCGARPTRTSRRASPPAAPAGHSR